MLCHDCPTPVYIQAAAAPVYRTVRWLSIGMVAAGGPVVMVMGFLPRLRPAEFLVRPTKGEKEWLAASVGAGGDVTNTARGESRANERTESGHACNRRSLVLIEYVLERKATSTRWWWCTIGRGL